MGVFQGTSLELQSACDECAQPAEVRPHLPVGSRSTVQASMPIGVCATDPPGTGAPLVGTSRICTPGEVTPSAEHQRVRERVPRNCGMLQAKATHLFFSEAMTEGTAGNRRRHHPLRSDLQKSKRRAVCGSKETPEPPSPRGQGWHCLCKHRGNHTVPTCTADSPRGSVDGTDERLALNPRLSQYHRRPRTHSETGVWAPEKGCPYKGRLSACAVFSNCSRTRNRAQYTLSLIHI